MTRVADRAKALRPRPAIADCPGSPGRIADSRSGWLAMLVVALLLTAPAWADETSPELSKYDARIDKSVDKALAYLAKNQLKDGSFACPMKGNKAVTSLCVMAMLAKGNTPGRGPYGEAINRGVDFVLAGRRSSP